MLYGWFWSRLVAWGGQDRGQEVARCRLQATDKLQVHVVQQGLSYADSWITDRPIL